METLFDKLYFKLMLTRSRIRKRYNVLFKIEYKEDRILKKAAGFFIFGPYMIFLYGGVFLLLYLLAAYLIGTYLHDTMFYTVIRGFLDDDFFLKRFFAGVLNVLNEEDAIIKETLSANIFTKILFGYYRVVLYFWLKVIFTDCLLSTEWTFLLVVMAGGIHRWISERTMKIKRPNGPLYCWEEDQYNSINYDRTPEYMEKYLYYLTGKEKKKAEKLLETKRLSEQKALNNDPV